MEKVFHFCKSYADNFTLQSRNLLFVGGTGLSKTHLSLSIANVVVQKGFSVVYDSVQNLVSKLENEHFRNSSEQSGTEDIIYGCDLLILDDLGTEFKSPFVIASLYNLVNTRILTKKPTIISTNLTPEEIEQFYSIRFLSRISGNYVRMPFSGKDIRVLKALKRNNN